MSSRDNGTYRLRPPPPPPRRTSSSRETSPDSGLSVSSTSSIPSTTSLEAASVTEQSHDSQLLEDICSSLDSSTLTVLSLPAVNSKAEKLRTNSHSLNDLKVKEVNNLAPQKPPVPVRRDSLRLERRQSNRAKLEDRFSFHKEDVFPPPPPFTNCPKTFPTKELFGVQSPIPEYKPYEEENKVETPSNPIINAKPKSKKSDGTFFSKIFPSTSQSEPLQTTSSDARYEITCTTCITYDMYDNWQLNLTTDNRFITNFHQIWCLRGEEGCSLFQTWKQKACHRKEANTGSEINIHSAGKWQTHLKACVSLPVAVHCSPSPDTVLEYVRGRWPRQGECQPRHQDQGAGTGRQKGATAASCEGAVKWPSSCS